MSLYQTLPQPYQSGSLSRSQWWSTEEDRIMAHDQHQKALRNMGYDQNNHQAYLDAHIKQARADALMQAMQSGLISIEDVLSFPLDWNALAMDHFSKPNAESDMLSIRRHASQSPIVSQATPSSASSASTSASNSTSELAPLLSSSSSSISLEKQIDDNSHIDIDAFTTTTTPSPEAQSLDQQQYIDYDRASASSSDVSLSPTRASATSFLFSDDEPYSHCDEGISTPSTAYSVLFTFNDLQSSAKQS